MTSAAFLEVRELRGGYGRLEVLHGLTLEVRRGEIAVLLGANGAGKTTTLRAISGVVKTKGYVGLAGVDLQGKTPVAIAKAGIAHVPQGRGTFTHLTVDENLRVGGYLMARGEVAQDIERWYATFPALADRRKQRAGQLSGGEQQMLAIARALMMRPKLLLLDEPSLGLAPRVTQALFAMLQEVNVRIGTTMLMVEQNAALALDIAANGFVLENGRISVAGEAAGLKADDRIRRAYLGA